MNVTLVDKPCNPLHTLATAYRTCRCEDAPWYDQSFEVDDIMLLSRCLPLGHRVPLEQIQLVFGIEGMSRACSAQFLRYRTGFSPVQQSQRATKPSGVVLPSSLIHDMEARALLKQIQEWYDKKVAAGVPKEDARYLLPMGSESNIQVAINLSELIHICSDRLCYKAQDEIRSFVDKIRKAAIDGIGALGCVIQPYLDRKCSSTLLGYCQESSQCAWGKAAKVPTKDDFLHWRRTK